MLRTTTLRKKLRFILVALALLAGVFTSTATTLAVTEQPASANGGYPDWNATDCSAQFGIYSWCKNGTWLSGRGYAYRNCTDFVAWKLLSLGVPSSKVSGLGNANTWDDNAPSKGVTVNGTPAAGSVAISNAGSFGHIAFVESVSGGNITVSEYNHAGTGVYGTRTGTPAGLGFTHFAHFEAHMPDPPGSGPSNGKTDIFQATGDPNLGWRVSYNGTSSWDSLTQSAVPASQLAIGDFDGDGREDDVFRASGDPSIGWQVSYNGTSAWNPLHQSVTTMGTLLLGYFN